MVAAFTGAEPAPDPVGLSDHEGMLQALWLDWAACADLFGRALAPFALWRLLALGSEEHGLVSVAAGREALPIPVRNFSWGQSCELALHD